MRLKVADNQTGAWVLDTFQFQTGAIKSQRRRADPRSSPLFQFQTGAIKRRDDQVSDARDKPTFQFQPGAIKRWEGYFALTDLQTFQFQTGAIKRHR